MAHAQYLGNYFPSAVPGYQQEPGVTVASRLRPMYDPLGVRLGSLMLRPSLDQSLGYNSNVAGFPSARGSWFVNTAPSITLNSDWSRNLLGASFTLSDYRFLDTPAQSHTDWTVGLGGGYTIGRHNAIIGYSHLSLHESAASVGSVASATPLPFQVDDVRAEYTFDQGRFSFTPRLDLQRYQFGNATIGGLEVSQQAQNRVVLNGGVETRYALSDLRSLVFVAQGIDSHYTNPRPGDPTNDSKSLLALGGIDYTADGVWRYRLLGGIELRDFAAAQFKTRTAPIAEASVIWTPTGMTTLTGTLSRTIEDPAAAGTGGYTYTKAGLVVDHEYLRNVLLQGRLGLESAEYLRGGGTQTSLTAAAQVQWLLNRNMRLAFDYSFTDQTGSRYAGFTTAGGTVTTKVDANFTRNVAILSLRLGL